MALRQFRDARVQKRFVLPLWIVQVLATAVISAAAVYELIQLSKQSASKYGSNSAIIYFAAMEYNLIPAITVQSSDTPVSSTFHPSITASASTDPSKADPGVESPLARDQGINDSATQSFRLPSLPPTSPLLPSTLASTTIPESPSTTANSAAPSLESNKPQTDISPPAPIPTAATILDSRPTATIPKRRPSTASSVYSLHSTKSTRSLSAPEVPPLPTILSQVSNSAFNRRRSNDTSPNQYDVASNPFMERHDNAKSHRRQTSAPTLQSASAASIVPLSRFNSSTASLRGSALPAQPLPRRPRAGSSIKSRYYSGVTPTDARPEK
ncbi:MAG: hypothetical protein Q9162_002993 [Coniocarpon cinnabarinum]